jgi:hypothetical protein
MYLLPTVFLLVFLPTIFLLPIHTYSEREQQ